MGLKSATKNVVHWPALVLLPCFSPFMFSGKKREENKLLVVSKNWTFVNMTLNLITATGGILAIFWWGHIRQGYLLDVTSSTSLPLLASSIICLIIIFCSRYCCQKLTQKTGFILNPDNSVAFMDLETIDETHNVEMTEVIEKP